MIQALKTSLFLNLIIVLMFYSFNTCWAENVEILPIKSVPNLKTPTSNDTVKVTFSGRGTIQRIGKDEVGAELIVLDDRLFYFSKFIKFYDHKGNSISQIPFFEGKTIDYIFNEKREVTGLYLTAN